MKKAGSLKAPACPERLIVLLVSPMQVNNAVIVLSVWGDAKLKISLLKRVQKRQGAAAQIMSHADVIKR